MSFDLSRYHFKSDTIFKGINAECFDELEQIKTVQHFPKGHLLYEENSRPIAVYHLLKGKVKIEQLGVDGKTRLFYIYAEGEYFGFRPLLSNQNHPVSATLLEDSALEVFEGKQFKECVKRFADLSFNLIEILSYEFNVWVNLMASLSHKSAKERIALVLLILNEKYKNENEPAQITMTKSDIARYSETTEETVVRTLSNFAETGIVANAGRLFEIIDAEALKAIADGF